jgi:hypothetical protein
MGLGAGIIQNKALTTDDVDNIFSLKIYAELIMTVIFSLALFPVSLF